MTEPSPSPAATDVPALVIATASDLLGDADLSPATDFFSAGGDSMIAMHLVSRLARATGLRLRVRLLIANPVLGDFAAEVAALAEAAGDGNPVGAATAG
jgi:aryl carrier-like protein